MTSRYGLLAVLLALAVSACGGSSSEDTSSLSNAQATATAIIQKANAQATANAIVSNAQSTANALAAVDTKQAPAPATKPRKASAKVRVAKATPTNTPRPRATNTPTPKPKATNTPRPKPTNTPTPEPTNTPRPEPTNTPVPAPDITLYVDAADQGYTGANLRARPTRQADLILLVKNGERVSAEAQTVTGPDGEEWYRVEYGGNSGYVLGSLMSLHKPAPVVAPEAEVITLYVDAAPYGFPAGVNVRAQPSMDAAILEGYENGTKLQVFDRLIQGSDGESWYEVLFASRTGYARAKLLSESPPDTVDPVQPTGDTHEVVYKVSGTASSVDISYYNATGGTSESPGRNLPWSKTFTVTGDPSLSVWATSEQESHNTLTCEIFIDGQSVETTKSDGTGYVEVDCTYYGP